MTSQAPHAPTNGAYVSPSRESAAAVSALARFASQASIEVTRPSSKDLADLREALPPGARVYLTAVPRRPSSELVAAAAAVRASGFEPTPHIAARHFATLDDVDAVVGELVERAGVRTIMLIGGDMAPVPGRVPDALTVIESGILGKRGVAEIGLPAFPDGHPVLSDEELELALVTKTAAAQSAGLSAHLVTQFCFESRPIRNWLVWLRGRGINLRARIGFAGPTSLMGWLNFARKCGVRASAEGLASRSGLAKHVFKAVAPDELLRDIAPAAALGQFGDIEPHFFAFGGAGASARWIQSVARGRIVLNAEGGFTIHD